MTRSLLSFVLATLQTPSITGCILEVHLLTNDVTMDNKTMQPMHQAYDHFSQSLYTVPQQHELPPTQCLGRKAPHSYEMPFCGP